MGRWGDPREIGGLVVVYLASEAGNFMTRQRARCSMAGSSCGE